MKNIKRTLPSIIVLLLFFCSSAWAETKGGTSTKTVFHGNSKSHIYHSPSCRYYNCKKCTIILKSETEAKEKGYRKCRSE